MHLLSWLTFALFVMNILGYLCIEFPFSMTFVPSRAEIARFSRCVVIQRECFGNNLSLPQRLERVKFQQISTVQFVQETLTTRYVSIFKKYDVIKGSISDGNVQILDNLTKPDTLNLRNNLAVRLVVRNYRTDNRHSLLYRNVTGLRTGAACFLFFSVLFVLVQPNPFFCSVLANRGSPLWFDQAITPEFTLAIRLLDKNIR